MPYTTNMTPAKADLHTQFIDATGLAVEPIVVAGYTFPMHSSYSFNSKKVYTEDNQRGIQGQLVFNEKFFVPTFKVKWNYVSIKDFVEIMRRLRTDEEPVIYYDMWANMYKRAMFYAQEPTFGDIHGVRKYIKNGEVPECVTYYGGVPNLEIIFAGTMKDMQLLTLNYNLNGGTGTTPTAQSGYDGEEFTVAKRENNFYRAGYYFTGWNTVENGSGEQYVPGTRRVFDSSETLYAQWVSADTTY